MKLYGIVVDHPTRGKLHAGKFYRSKDVAKSWRSFVAAYWNLSARVAWVASTWPREAQGGGGGE